MGLELGSHETPSLQDDKLPKQRERERDSKAHTDRQQLEGSSVICHLCTGATTF
jgi:hypothetical protein